MPNVFSLTPDATRGRLYPELESKNRSAFQRDRDRIIHSSAFRKLKHKTQVFVAHEGDYFRTRLTHSIEVGQISRSISKLLGLNVDLTEAIALAHDLGHTPFGHAGEEALNECMLTYGGFDHNAQAIKIVTKLEQKYAEFDGLNLTWETLEGIAKHNGPLKDDINYYLRSYNQKHNLDFHTYPSCEAQVASISDDIAYNNHDLSDGLRAGLFNASELLGLPIIGSCFREVDKKYTNLEEHRRQHEVFRRVFSLMVEDVLNESRPRLAKLRSPSSKQKRNPKFPVIQFSDSLSKDLAVIKSFLYERMYRHWKVNRMRFKANRIIKELFLIFSEQGDVLPEDWQRLLDFENERGRARIISDYIAGMTDRYALMEHSRLTNQRFFDQSYE